MEVTVRAMAATATAVAMLVSAATAGADPADQVLASRFSKLCQDGGIRSAAT